MPSRVFYLGVTAVLLLGMVSVAVADGPAILNLNPTQNALSVSLATSIDVTFDVDMDETSFTEATFLVSAGHTGRHFGTFSYINAARTVTFTPDDAFQVGDVVYLINYVFKDGPAPCADCR